MNNQKTHAQLKAERAKQGFASHFINGEFHCPFCHCIIGKNLKDERPIHFALEHLRELHGYNPDFKIIGERKKDEDIATDEERSRGPHRAKFEKF